jgi:thiamine biosynthesis protein ThiS
LRVHLNGEGKELPPDLTLQELVENLELKSERVAVELNGVVVPRSRWLSTVLCDNDRVEVVHFVGGGSCFSFSRAGCKVESKIR